MSCSSAFLLHADRQRSGGGAVPVQLHKVAVRHHRRLAVACAHGENITRLPFLSSHFALRSLDQATVISCSFTCFAALLYASVTLAHVQVRPDWSRP